MAGTRDKVQEIDIHNVVVRTAFAAFPRNVYKADARADKNPDHPGFVTKLVTDEDDLADAIDEGWKETHIDPVVPKVRRGRAAAAVAVAVREASTAAAPAAPAAGTKTRARKPKA